MIRFRIAVCTYQRPAMLQNALAALREQTRASVEHEGASLLVVDNDALRSAEPVARLFGADYVTEPKKGLGYARNQALALSDGFDALIFFDDDQVPDAGWLEAFSAAHRADPDAIWSGPVQPKLPASLPRWAGDGWPWSRAQFQDRTYLTHSGDGNLLIPKSVLVRAECLYDERFATTMGQDVELTERLHRIGVSIRHARAASALEILGEERLRPEWAIARAYSSAEARARIWLLHERTLLPLIKSYITNVMRALYHLGVGMLGSQESRVKQRCASARLSAYWSVFRRRAALC